MCTGGSPKYRPRVVDIHNRSSRQKSFVNLGRVIIPFGVNVSETKVGLMLGQSRGHSTSIGPTLCQPLMFAGSRNEMKNGVLGHLCAQTGQTGPGKTPEDGQINRD